MANYSMLCYSIVHTAAESHGWSGSPPSPSANRYPKYDDERVFRAPSVLGAEKTSEVAVLGAFRVIFNCLAARLVYQPMDGEMTTQGRIVQSHEGVQTTQKAKIYLGGVWTSQSDQVLTFSLMKYHSEVSSEAKLSLRRSRYSTHTHIHVCIYIYMYT